ncbi:hypothetical protein LHJ74_10950 [Streptomyces sp. N2-109]|uniref:Sporulation protein n=1 Tax=Streptomyces gossypii TaxID=2883101 RepID=A0ABT2JRC5_9ACTN|nr:hypothetical protein [Streptomyces gossypii]MCT2590422.1 hypothetical protein [Streptomyces gossypii]
MPDNVGGQPLPDGEEPDNRHHGGADDEFAAVVFDEDFVRSAEVHEPTAVERILAAAQSHAESHAEADPRPYDEPSGLPYATDAGYAYTSGYDYEYEHGHDHGYVYGEDDVPRPYRGHSRWQRPVAWVLAVVMGIGMVALTFSAVYRGASSEREEPTQPPATSDVGSTSDGSGSSEGPNGSLREPERVAPGGAP